MPVYLKIPRLVRTSISTHTDPAGVRQSARGYIADFLSFMRSGSQSVNPDGAVNMGVIRENSLKCITYNNTQSLAIYDNVPVVRLSDATKLAPNNDRAVVDRSSYSIRVGERANLSIEYGIPANTFSEVTLAESPNTTDYSYFYQAEGNLPLLGKFTCLSADVVETDSVLPAIDPRTSCIVNYAPALNAMLASSYYTRYNTNVERLVHFPAVNLVFNCEYFVNRKLKFWQVVVYTDENWLERNGVQNASTNFNERECIGAVIHSGYVSNRQSGKGISQTVKTFSSRLGRYRWLFRSVKAKHKYIQKYNATASDWVCPENLASTSSNGLEKLVASSFKALKEKTININPLVLLREE